MSQKFARLNLQLKDGPGLADMVKRYQAALFDAAIEGYGDEDEFEVFYEEKNRIVGVSIPFDNEVSLLEAGSTLGYCLCECGKPDDLSYINSWLSIHDWDDSLISSPVGESPLTD